MQRDLDQLEHNQFDLLVVGGGIYGICIARDAVLRGLRVALIEANDFGSGTSHNSLKIIHGGIRYLQHLNFRRVQESVREREMWVSISNRLIKPLRFVLPTYGYGTRGPLALAAAVKMHNRMAAMQNKNRAYPDGYMISKSECSRLISGLNNENISGGAVWYDGQIVDADRLHVELLKDASRRGLCLANYLKAEEINISSAKASGVMAADQLTKRSFNINASIVINATGPWAYRLLKQNFQNNKYQHQPLSKNFNIVVDHIGKDFAFGVKSKRASDAVVGSSKRMYFFTPWLNKTVIGTAHFEHGASQALDADISTELPEFVEEINEAYPSFNLDMQDIRYSYSGFTPAEPEDGKKSVSRSHLTSMIDHAEEDGIDNLLSVVGVKYTTARSTAQRVVDLVLTKLKYDSKQVKVPCNYALDKKIDKFAEIDELSLKSVVTEQELDSIYRSKIEEHIDHAIEEEMVLQLDDYILRRSNLAIRGLLLKSDVDGIVDKLAKKLSLSLEQMNSQLEIINNKLKLY